VFESGFEVLTGVDTRPEYLVKPFGSLKDPLMMISSYPTADEKSTVHLEYATVNDLSNIGMSQLYVKAGYHDVQTRKTGMLHMVIFPRRLDRKKVLSSSAGVLNNMPRVLRILWQTFAVHCIQLSKAVVVCVSGHSANQLYRAWLKEQNIAHNIIWAFGIKRTEHKLPIAIQGFTDDTQTRMSRLVLVVYRIEAFTRTRTQRPTDMQRNMVMRERFLDFANVLIHQSAPLQPLLSTGAYLFQTSTGILIPLQAF